jgi:aspartyl protease family protein
LLIVLAFLSYGFLSKSPLRFSKVIKYFLIWSTAALFIVIIYSYRFEFSDFKDRILGEINPSQARATKLGSIIINIAEDGHFYINLKLNGNNVRFMVDTGASDIVLNLGEAKRIGLNLSNLKFNKPYQTANGTSWGANTQIKELQIGDLIIHDITVSVNNADMGTSLLGMSFLKRFKKYEFYRDKLELTI